MFNLFRQLLPVIKGGNGAEVVSSCFKASMLWSSFERLSLTINVRLMNAPFTAKAMKYDSWLCLVGNGVTQNDNTIELSFQNVYQIQSSERTSCMRQAIHCGFGENISVGVLILLTFDGSTSGYYYILFRGESWKMVVACWLSSTLLFSN